MDIKIWDWRYRLFFNDQLLEQVKSFSSTLSKKEKYVYESLLEFYHSFYSFGILFNQIQEDLASSNELQVKETVRKAAQNTEKLIHLPDVLYNHYTDKINELKIAGNTKDVLRELLDASTRGKYVYNEYLRINQLLFGNIFDDLVKIAVKNGMRVKNRDKGAKINSEDAEIIKCFQEIYNSTEHATDINNKFGNVRIDDFDIEIMKGPGYGEWWDKTLTGQKNRMVLYKNKDSLYYNDLKYTIIHELYPGHGHFYKSIETAIDSKIDHGLIEVIEGWATYAEWNSIDSEYIRAIRKNALNMLKNSVELDFKSFTEKTYKIKKEQGVSDINLIHFTNYLTQYIGFSESYYWGALMFEFLFDIKKVLTPHEFLTKGISTLGRYLYE